MKAQVLAPNTGTYDPYEVSPFGWRSKQSIRRGKYLGVLVAVVAPVILNVVMGVLS